MKLANRGITLQVTDDGGRHRGYLVINKAYIGWYQGKERSLRYQKHLKTFIAEAEA